MGAKEGALAGSGSGPAKSIGWPGRLWICPELAMYLTAEALRRGEKRAEDHLCWIDQIITCIRNCDDVRTYRGRAAVGRQADSLARNCRRLRETGCLLWEGDPDSPGGLPLPGVRPGPSQ